MKKNDNKKYAKKSETKLVSPNFQRKKNFFSKSSFKELEKNFVALSPKKSQDEFFLP